jgi:hypothetical protein
MYDLQVMITSSVRMSYRHLDNARMCLENTRALLHAITAKTFFILKAHGPLRVVEHVTALGYPLEQDPESWLGYPLEQDPESWDTWQHRSPSE